MCFACTGQGRVVRRLDLHRTGGARIVDVMTFREGFEMAFIPGSRKRNVTMRAPDSKLKRSKPGKGTKMSTSVRESHFSSRAKSSP